MKNIILTGERGAGKSTLADKAAACSGLKARGLKTLFKESREEPHAFLYAAPWGREPVFDERHIIARFGGGRPEGLTESFDTLCAGLVDKAVDSADAELIIIDELGFLEKDALRFRDSVLRALNCPKPVIAVIRQGLPAWTTGLVDAGPCILFEVTEENRGRLADKVLNILRMNNSK